MKIYNEIVIDMNPESSSYGKTLHEDSFDYSGDMILFREEEPICPEGQIIGPDGTCIVPKDPFVGGCDSDADCPYPQTCVGGACTQNEITCWDGSMRESLAECPDPEYDFQTPSEWIEGEDWTKPEWYEDLATGKLEWEDYLFETVAGGKEGTGYEKKEWLDLYKEYFPEFEDSYQFQQYANILEQMGMEEQGKESLYDAWRASKEASILETEAVSTKYGTDYEGLTYTAESQFIGAGGGVSGRNIAKMKRLSKGLSIGQSLELEGIQMDIEAHQDTYDRQLQTVDKAQERLEDQLLRLEQEYAEGLDALFDPSFMSFDCDDDHPCETGKECINNVCLGEEEVADPEWTDCMTTCFQGTGTPIHECTEQCTGVGDDDNIWTEGTDIADIDLSGLTRDEALDKIAELRYGWKPGAGVAGQEWDIPWSQIGDEYDTWLAEGGEVGDLKSCWNCVLQDVPSVVDDDGNVSDEASVQCVNAKTGKNCADECCE